MTRNEMLLRYEQHRDNADELLREADHYGPGADASTNLAVRANAHATMALLYLTDLLSDQ